jgi:transposase
LGLVLAAKANEDINGLKDRSKSGRPTEIPKVAVRIRKELLGSKQGWTTKQVRDMIFRERRYYYTHVYRILHKWGFKQKIPRKVHINTASNKEKEDFKKRTNEILGDGFTTVSLDESFFLYDSLVRRVWIYKNIKPVVKVTGSHKHLCLFGAVGFLDKAPQHYKSQKVRHYFEKPVFLYVGRCYHRVNVLELDFLNYWPSY